MAGSGAAGRGEIGAACAQDWYHTVSAQFKKPFLNGFHDFGWILFKKDLDFSALGTSLGLAIDACESMGPRDHVWHVFPLA
eukprot:CAMPEP_0174940536 /NCGR_PEP_ID=MMETSP1355-20121228/69390_1 /TAXON_ID=464990 /ORGANISM="Hemiselmis tepida, Strain CCMP443" /LENGTH=80 /DNA_ID=CAMNT_0016187593 /DNA_START=230 /DNA_END=468 /DNA_ORIENTATION=+